MTMSKYLAALFLAGTVLTTEAGAVTLAASANFNFNSGVLTIVLKNTGDFSTAGGNELSGVFFDIAGNPALTPMSATVAAGAIKGTCSDASCATVTNVAGEFGYQFAASGFSGGPASHYGISSSGYLTTGLAGNIGNFNGGAAGTNLDDPNSLDGSNFGIIATGGVYNSAPPLVQDQVTFVLNYNAALFPSLSMSNVSNVSFQYGASFTGSSVTAGCDPRTGTCGGGPGGNVPEPASVLLFGAVFAVTIGALRRRMGSAA
jgi:hypothetical protein